MLVLTTIFLLIILIKSVCFKIFIKKSWPATFNFCIIANIISFIATILSLFLIMFIIKSEFTTKLLIFFVPLIISIHVEYKIYKVFWDKLSIKKLLGLIIVINITILTPLEFLIIIYIGQHREEARRLSCQSKLKGIGLSLIQYSMNYNNFFPDKGLEQLRPNAYLTDYGVYTCPSTDTRKGKNNEKLTDKIVDYIYPKGLKYSNDSKTPLLWDKLKNHKNYGNVLFIDGHVKRFRGANWMEQAGITKAKK